MQNVPATAALLEFVLSHAQIQTNVCTRQKMEHGYTLEPRVVTDHNLIFVTRGRVVWVVDDEAVELPAQTMVLVPPGVPHHAFSHTKRVTLGSLHVNVTLPGGQSAFDLLLPPLRQTFDAGSAMDRYLRGFLNEFDRAEELQINQMTPGWARLIVFQMLRDSFAAGTLQQMSLDPVVSEMLEMLGMCIGSDITLDELAHRSGYSAQHLNRTFRSVLGVTPLQYLTRMRMEKAASMLRSGQYLIRAIGEAAGYVDPYYFSRVFRQHFGRSPAQFRDELGQPPA
jgi:AraC-like DNA-binding protein